MCNFSKAEFRGDEAAQRPQLTPVSKVYMFSANPRVSCSSSISAISCSIFSSPKKIHRLNQCTTSHRRSCGEEGRQISCLSDHSKFESKFESIRTKSSMNSFTNHLGRVYHV